MNNRHSNEASATSLTAKPLPPVENKPENILSAWIALEVLSPQSYEYRKDLANGDNNRIFEFKESSLPWETRKIQHEHETYYQIILGSIDMTKVMSSLAKKFSDNPYNPVEVRGNAILAVITVNSIGCMIEPPVISSFGWGVITALDGNLTDLTSWADYEYNFTVSLDDTLLGITSKDDDREELRKYPLSGSRIFKAYRQLVESFGIPDEWLETPQFAVKFINKSKNPKPSEPLLMNSFFLRDLEVARRMFKEEKATDNLIRYLNIAPPLKAKDLLKDVDTLEKAICPATTPLSRWPGKGRHPLVLLQQAAVNLIFQETNHGGLIGINGPPGTGKTTLLRDVVANVITLRAEAMSKFDDPQKAFSDKGFRYNLGGEIYYNLYKLDDSLRGFEMVVASSNNKAVENVSAELPGINSITDDLTELRYFKSLSDKLHGTETWGAIAAVLGNRKNRDEFKQTFWWDKENRLPFYLKTVEGRGDEVLILDENGTRRTPTIVDVEKPPTNHNEALSNWRKAKKRFLEALEKSHIDQVYLEDLRSKLQMLPALEQSVVDAELELKQAEESVNKTKDELEVAKIEDAEAMYSLLKTEQELQLHNLIKPKWWYTIFYPSQIREWQLKYKALKKAYLEAQTHKAGITAKTMRIENDLRLADKKRLEKVRALDTARIEYLKVKQPLAEAKQKGVPIADKTFFETENDVKHKSTPWYTAESQHLRDEVFVSAMLLHRAFIDGAANRLRHNLGVLMEVFMGHPFSIPEHQKLLPDLWSSLFLVVPLVSTTFASMHGMFGKLPPESLGWLLIDEAGQATPQSAIGGIIRTRRAVIVGDPIQIEPVVKLPEGLPVSVFKHFGVDSDRYCAPNVSAQTLADAASSYISEFETSAENRKVGVPLLVHRRCAKPMFAISNTIAYSNMMVFATPSRQSRIMELLGPSAWFDIEGSQGEGNWCPEEGYKVLDLLHILADKQINPDLYIVSPFRIVANNLLSLLRGSIDHNSFKACSNKSIFDWTKERVGTVHTAQGREAEAVIFVLGAPSPSQSGARNWAGGKPNLLNVAVSRAKEAVYVIGNRGLWQNAGLFAELHCGLDKIRTPET